MRCSHFLSHAILSSTRGASTTTPGPARLRRALSRLPGAPRGPPERPPPRAGRRGAARPGKTPAPASCLRGYVKWKGTPGPASRNGLNGDRHAGRLTGDGRTPGWRHGPRGPAGPSLAPIFLSETRRAAPGGWGREGSRCRAEPPYLAPRSRRSGRSRCRQPSAAPAAASCCGRGPSSPLGARRGAELGARLSSGRKMRNWRAAPAPRGAPFSSRAPGRALLGRPSGRLLAAALPAGRPRPRGKVRGGAGRGQPGESPPGPLRDGAREASRPRYEEISLPSAESRRG